MNFDLEIIFICPDFKMSFCDYVQLWKFSGKFSGLPDKESNQMSSSSTLAKNIMLRKGQSDFQEYWGSFLANSF